MNIRQKFVFFLFLYNVKSLLRILFNLFASFFVKRLRQNSCNKSHSCNFIFRHNKRDSQAVLYAEGKSDFCFVIVLLSLITYNHWYNALYSVPAVIKRKIMTSYDLLLFLFLLKPFQWLFIMMIFAMNSRYRGIQHLFDSIVYHKICFFYFASNVIIFSHTIFCYQIRVISYAFIWKFCKSEVVLDTFWFSNVWNIY